MSWKGSSSENPSTLCAVTAEDETCRSSRLPAQTSSCWWHCDTEMLEPTWHTGGCRAAEPSTGTLTQGIPKKRGQPHHKQHFQGYPHGRLPQVQGAQQFLSQQLLNCCVLLFNKPSPNCCNYLFTCLLTPLTSPRMSSHANTAHQSQPSSH